MSQSKILVSVVEVLILQRFPYGQDSTFFYYAAGKNLDLSAGDIVTVPWRKGTKNGTVVKIKKTYISSRLPKDSWQVNLKEQIKDGKFFYSPLPDRMIKLKPVENLLEKQFLLPDLLNKLRLAAKQHGVSWNHFANYAVKLPPAKRKNKFLFLPLLGEWFKKIKKNNGKLLNNYQGVDIKKGGCPLIFASQEQSFQVGPLLKEKLLDNKQILVIVPEKSHIVPIAAKYAFISNSYSIATPIIMGKFLPSGIVRSTWQLAKKGGPHIFVGTRSSIFAPYFKLGLIILEEGHDASHKQWDLVPLYDTRNILKTLYPEIPKLYVSGSPRLQDFFGSPCYLKGEGNILKTVFLNWKKILSRKLPPSPAYGEASPLLLKSSVIYEGNKKKVSLLNTNKEWGFLKDPAAISGYLLENLQSVLMKGRWAVVLTSHGGFANTIMCKDCGFIPRCPVCGKHLKIRTQKSFYCSVCNRDLPAYNRCPQCSGHSFFLLNFGLETLKEKMVELQKKIKFKLIIPPDLKSGNRSLVAYWHDLAARSGKPTVLIGHSGVIAPARLLNKNIALAASVSFDNILYHPDYRAEEKAAALFFNLLSLAPHVIIQTRDPLQPLWHNLLKHAYSALFPSWIRERKNFLYPPFCDLIRLGIAGAESHRENDSSTRLRQLLSREKNVYDILEIPAKTGSPKIKYKTNLLVKLQRNSDPDVLLQKISREFQKLKVDPDPEILI